MKTEDKIPMMNEIDSLLHQTLDFVTRSSGGTMMHVVEELELSLPQLIMLDMAAREDQTVSSLAEHLRFTPGAVSRLADRLVRKGYLSREEGLEDRRRKILRLTEEGKRIKDRVESARSGSFTSAMSGLDIAVMTEFRDALLHLVKALNEKQERVQP